MLFDSHAHYNDSQFDEDREEILGKLEKNGIGYVIDAADSMESCEKILRLSEKFPFIYASVGVHPENVGDMTEGDIKVLSEKCKNKKVRAIGEIGLDYHYDDVSKDVQKYWFKRQIELAEKVGLPIIVHDREAHGDCMEILKRYDIEKIGGVMHCYSGSAEMAREVTSMGMYLGFGGTLTFKNAKKVQEAAKITPLSRILLETDCPYLAPEPNRGKRNSSLYMHYVAEKLAEIKEITVEEVEETTFENAKRLYGIED